ncbi:hypothetical protein CABS01_05074 [Colletotrichum abscissum]|uniref:Uncharacterized protein n=1 Tax=Colletotrichum abscissum TaxID=1671311 RepID=A0A9P9X5L7_9PEZI|nr:uncharacterized protein CABS01_05074 [Colletotrichum abscissum]KAI3537020.1 hypothetical protein CABS02_12294 [Colletotrichum abscissum]KAK1523453.1 hypothetical protein CABS01_05074 [Colletotrichum abscissum]
MADSDNRSDDRIIAESIWGPCESSQEKHLARFLDHCALQRLSLCIDQPRTGDSTNEIAGAIRLLRSKPAVRKDEILSRMSPNLSRLAYLDCAVRTMLMTECELEGTAAIGSGNVLRWVESETLTDYLGRIYPQSTSMDVPKDLIDLKNLRCHILARDAGIKIQQTEKLSDHLYLRHSPGNKILLVFSHRAFLKHSREILSVTRQDLSHSTDEALALGCLPAKLIDETLRSYNLLFPPIGNAKSRKLLREWVKRERLDESLLNPSFDHSKQDPPRTLHDLYEDFPYWAPQLARLLEEVDDPTPTTRWERYAERRKSHRHTYKCAIAALVVAAVSGTLATLLAAVQVWISYCDWDKNTNKTLC